jgi:NYN domain
MQPRMSAWVAESPEKVELFPRPLRYGNRGAEEKGVDVELAIDIVRLAIEDAFDVAVLASGDTDLVPALKFVAGRFSEKALVTLGYAPEPGYMGQAPPAPLDLAEATLERRFITKRDFDRMADKRNFYESTSDASKAPLCQARVRQRLLSDH